MFRNVLTAPAYHFVSDRQISCSAMLGVTTPVAVFEQHLDHFARHFDVVDLDTVISGRLPARPLLLTFDDSYRSTLDTVGPILRRRGLPGVVFLNPDPIEHEIVMFDHLLSDIATHFGTSALMAAIGAEAAGATSVQSYLNGPAVGLAKSARDELIERLLETFDLDAATLRSEWDIYLEPHDIKGFADFGLDVGNHTASHTRVRTLSAEEAQYEIADAKSRLERLAGRPVRSFSVPYGAGADLTCAASRALLGSGHDVAFLCYGRRTGVNLHRRADGLQVWDRLPLDNVALVDLPRQLTYQPVYRGFKDAMRRRLIA
jgi:peptidoglycan/xylan/chitin deacetylase (PgdA/CDA1 family)